MKIGITGSHGTVGKSLVPFLQKEGYSVIGLPREGIDLSGVDVVINLAGSPIFEWNKKEILNSRVETTKNLVEAMKSAPPKLFISASALAEGGFLGTVCKQWEEEAQKAPCRVVLLRLGVVLTPTGGALKKMLLPFRWGLGAILGTGEQWMSWVSMDDLLSIILFCIKNENISGPVEAVSPTPITNKEFTLWLAKKLHRPCLFRAPEWLLRPILGDFADEVLLASSKFYPTKLQASGFTFKDVDVENLNF